MKKLLLIVALVATANARGNELHTDTNKKEMACSKECYEAIRSLWLSGAITIEEAQVLWNKHKKNGKKKV